MKFGDLKLVFGREIDRIKENKQPTTKYIVRAYKTVLRAMEDEYSDKDTATAKKIDNLNITAHMKEKLTKMIQTPISRDNQRLRKNDILRADLDRFLGIGKKKIDELMSAGLKNIEHLYQKKWFDMLNKNTQTMLSHTPMRKIPYDNIKCIEPKLKGFKCLVEIVGSYRRKRPFSRDIDVLVVSSDENILDKYVIYLKKCFGNRVWPYATGDDKISLIIKPKSNIDVKYKLDIFRAEPSDYSTSLLYSTGSKEFNIKMRAKAKKYGYLLNQFGLFQNGKKLKLPNDEYAIFNALGMEYVPPEQRI